MQDNKNNRAKIKSFGLPKNITFFNFVIVNNKLSWHTIPLEKLKEPIINYAPKGIEGVLEANFFAFLIGPAWIAYRNLENAPTGGAVFGDFGRDLGFKPETVGF